jgi:hypothetical protein
MAYNCKRRARILFFLRDKVSRFKSFLRSFKVVICLNKSQTTYTYIITLYVKKSAISFSFGITRCI